MGNNLFVGRGGGSIEDLWAFNEEIVAHAIYDSTIPIISAVGHETDFTIADFVSDRRAPTPSAAAEIAVPDYREVLYTLDGMLDRMMNVLLSELERKKTFLAEREKNFSLLSPQKRIEQYAGITEMLGARMNNAAAQRFARFSNDVVSFASRLESVSPLKTLERGFAVALNEKLETVKSVSSVTAGEKISVRLFDGELKCTVNDVLPNEQLNGKE